MCKKLRKRMGAFCLSLALLTGSMVSVWGAQDDPDHAAIPPKTGSLTIHKFLMDDVTQAGDPNNGNPAGAANGNPEIPNSATPLGGIKFDVYQIEKTEDKDWPGTAPYRLNEDKTQMTDGAGITFNVEALSTPTYTTDDNGEVTISDMDQGIYLVIEQDDPRVTTPCDPFVVAVPMTNPEGNGWITDVHVYPKNENASVKKILVDSSDQDPSASSATIGDTMGYEIRPSVPTGIVAENAEEDAKIKYVIYDILDEALTLQEATITVKAVDGQGTPVETTLTKDTDYTVNLTAQLVDKTDPNNPVTSNGPFAIEFTKAGREKLNELKAKSLKIKFDVVVNEKILDKPFREVENKALVSFTNKWGDEQQTESDGVKIHTGIIDIKKVDASDKTKPLEGAEFQIALNEEDAKAGRFLKKLNDTPAPGQQTIIGPGHPSYAAGEAWVETSDANGTVRFEGLAVYTSTLDGDGNEITKDYLSYWIVETKAPEGYNLLDAPRELTFSEGNSNSEGGESDRYTMMGVEVENTNDFLLPKTGGIGTILFTVGGIVLIGGAGLLLVTSRKKKNQA